MINKNIFNIPFLGKKDNHLDKSFVFVAAIAGATIGYLLLKEYLTGQKPQAANEKGISDKRGNGRKSAEKLLGDIKHRQDPTKINVPEAGTLNWKKNQDKPMFPPVPDPNIRIT